MEAYFGESVPKLGFGAMRLPRKMARIDVEQTARMVDAFLGAGFTYFDTAYVYVGSEEALRRALVERHPRDSFTLASKCCAWMAPSARIAKGQLETSLRRSGAGYFDYYLLHSLKTENYRVFDRYGIWDFVQEKKREGLIRHVGFSYHSGPETLDEILTAHPEVEFVQLQLNYADWENRHVASRANYEVARSHGVGIVVMEPVKGGKLANPPAEVRRVFEEAAPEMSCASWAIRFAASLEGIVTVLSGMSNLGQMEDNLSYMRGFEPLSEAERAVVRRAQAAYGAAGIVGCTACGYCLDGCPRGIKIPQVLAALNLRRADGQLAEAQAAYDAAVAGGARAGECIACGACERACTQGLDVVRHLAEASAAFD